MDQLKALESMGLVLPSAAYVFGAIIFGILGYAAYRYGKKVPNETIKWLGVALMLYPYLVAETWQLYLVGVVLCAGVYFSRR